MIYALVFSCFVALSYGLSQELKSQMGAEMLRAGDKCKDESGVTPEDLAQLMVKVIPSNKEAKCFIACMHKYFGMQNSDGTINLGGAVAALDPVKSDDPDLHAKMVQLFERCVVPENQVDDPCETAALIGNCAIKVCTELGIESHLR